MQVKVYLANLKLNRIYHFEKQEIIANDYLTQTKLGYDFKNGIKELDEEGHYRLEKLNKK